MCVLALEEGRHEIAWGVQHSATVAVDDKGDNNKDVNKAQGGVIPPRIGSRKGFSAPGIRWPTLRRVELRNMEVDLGMVMRLMGAKASRLERVMVVGGLRRSESDEVERREWSRLERGLGVEIWKGWMGEDGEVVRQSWKSSGGGRDRGQRRGMKRGVVCHVFDRNVKIDTRIPTGYGEEKRAAEQVTKEWTSAEWRPGLRFEFIDSEDEDDRRKEIVGKGKEPRRVTKQVVIGRRAPIPDADDTAAVPSAEIEHEIREERYEGMPRKGIYVVADDETIVEEDWETEREKSDCEE